MNFKLFIAIFSLCSSISTSKYLTYKVDYHSIENFTDHGQIIEFWPDYEPNPRWIVENDRCLYDVKIEFIPFIQERMIDYDARNQGILPAIEFKYFRSQNLLPALEKIMKTSNSCSYDSVWYSSPSRFYGYHGFKMSVFDSFHNYSWTSYAPVPFLRNIDAVFRDPNTHRIVFISNHWYYAFDQQGGFVKQGRLSYLWSNFRASPYVDSVLITRNRTLCRFYDDKVQCTRFNAFAQRLLEGPSDIPRPFSDMFEGGFPEFPLKGSFWNDEHNETAILDSEDTFWIYDIHNRFSHKKPFCEYMGFGNLPCCRYHRPDYEKRIEYEFLTYWLTGIWSYFLF